MTAAHDVFAETNPGFCTYALAAFTSAYVSVNKDGPDVPILYVGLPIAMSGDLSPTFDGTNKNTGLMEWLERNPRVQIGLAMRVNASMIIVTEAIRFACFTGVLVLDERARLRTGPGKLKKSRVNALSNEPAKVIKHAERLGYWFAMAGSTRSIFDVTELTV